MQLRDRCNDENPTPVWVTIYFSSILITLYMTWRQAVSPGQRSLFYPATTSNIITLGRGLVYVVIFTNFLCLVSFIYFLSLNVSSSCRECFNLEEMTTQCSFFEVSQSFYSVQFSKFYEYGQRAKFTHFSHQSGDWIWLNPIRFTIPDCFLNFWTNGRTKSIEFREHSELFDN